MKKVLITGGAGFIGSHIVEQLLKSNYKVIVLDNFSSGSKKNLTDLNKIVLYPLNIEKNNLDKIFKIEKPDFVIHLAAQTSVSNSAANPYYDANINIMSTIKLLKCCKKHNIKKFIAASTAAVYGNPQYLPIDENHPTNPISQYGLSKLTMEKYIQMSGIPYVILRFSNAFGPRQKSSKEGGVIAIFNEAMKKNNSIYIYGDGKQIRDFIYVKDIANVCTKVLQSDIINEVLNFSTNKGISLNVLFNEMAKIHSYSQHPIYLEKRTEEVDESILSNSKILNYFSDLNFTPIPSGLLDLKNGLTNGK